MLCTTIASFTDPEEYEAALRASFGVSLLVPRNGGFHASFTSITLGRMTVMAGWERLPRVGFVTAPAGRILIGLPVARQSGPIWNGVEMTPDQVISLGASGSAHTRTLGPCAWSNVVSCQAGLLNSMRALSGTAIPPPSGLLAWRPDRAALDGAIALHAAAIRLVRRYPDLSQKPEAAHGLEEQLVAFLIRCMSGKPSEPRRGAAEEADLMARFEGLTRTQRDHPAAIREVCRALSASERTLRDACRIHLGMGPRQYLRLRWLQARQRNAQPRI